MSNRLRTGGGNLLVRGLAVGRGIRGPCSPPASSLYHPTFLLTTFSLIHSPSSFSSPSPLQQLHHTREEVTMKPSVVLSVLFISSASALNFFRQGSGDRSILGSSSEGPPVPGDNPLKHCGPTDEDIIEITKVDLDPNPPVPFVSPPPTVLLVYSPPRTNSWMFFLVEKNSASWLRVLFTTLSTRALRSL